MSSTSNDEHANDPLSLKHAARMADLVYRARNSELQQKDPSSSSSNSTNYRPPFFTNPPPGTVEGLTATVLTGLMLWPARNVAIRAAGKQLYAFAELLATSTQILVSFQAGLFVGSIYGSYKELDQFAQRRLPFDKDRSKTMSAPVLEAAVSGIEQRVCGDDSIQSYLKRPVWQPTKEGLLPPSMDPERIAMTAFRDALNRCRR